MFSSLSPSLYLKDWATQNRGLKYNEEDIPEFYRFRKLRPWLPFGQPECFIQGRHSSIESHVIGVQGNDVICFDTYYDNTTPL
jgi:hypothetical protein